MMQWIFFSNYKFLRMLKSFLIGFSYTEVWKLTFIRVLWLCVNVDLELIKGVVDALICKSCCLPFKYLGFFYKRESKTMLHSETISSKDQVLS